MNIDFKNLRCITVSVIALLLIAGCVSTEVEPSKEDLVEGTQFPPGVLLNEKNIKKFLPLGVKEDDLIAAYRVINGQKSYRSVNGRAIAISTLNRGGFFYTYDYHGNSYAKSAALKKCNQIYGDCVLYSIGNVIVYTGPFES